jgi:hypothetical protein
MTENENVLDSDPGVATILALVVTHQGGEIRIPAWLAGEPLPPNSGVRVQYDAVEDEFIIDIAKTVNEVPK